MAGIYIHIPFCKQACSYCDFYFVTRKGETDVFTDKLVEEIQSYAGTAYTDEAVQTIYFGGGTPSLLSAGQIGQIIQALRTTFDVRAEEITIEMNPDDVSAGYLSALKELGVNRASMGVQSFDPELLKFMNRAHSREESLKCIELLKAAGFKTFTVDLIYGNPGQSLHGLEEDVATLLQFEPPHVSAYSLTVEARTRLGKQVELGRILPAPDDMVAAHFDTINQMLAGHNIHRYEVSNYSKPGHEAVHNSHYWNHQNYLGFGPAAHSFWWEGKARRWSNKADLAAYLKSDETELKTGEEILSKQELAEERIMMGLRTRQGITVEEMACNYDYTFTEKQRGYLQQKEKEQKVSLSDSIVLTDSGIKIADAIILDLITLH